MIRKLTEMKKVIVVGCSGSGKTTFSIRLHEKTGLPLYHLDNVWWRADRTHISREEFDPELVALVTSYEEENKPVLRKLFSKYPDKNVNTFHTRSEAESWLEETHDNGKNETNN